jgi:hypothetical protein
VAKLSEVKMLRKLLVNSRFHFIPKGTQNLKNIQKVVKTFYPTLCDDSVKRKDNGENEWEHQVRLALDDIKDKPAVTKVNEGKRDGIWEFN